MSSDPNAAPPQGSYLPPAGPPPPVGSAPPAAGAPSPYPPPPGAPPGAPGAPPPGQQPYGSPYPPPPGGYNPYGYYQPPGGYWPPPPPGQYGQPGAPYYPPPAGQYAPPPGAPPAGQYPPPPGAPPAGQYAPPPGAPPAGQYAPPPGAPPAGQYAPPPGAPPAGQYPAPPGAPPAGQYPPPPGAPQAAGQYPPAAPGAYPPYGNPAFPLAVPPLGAPLGPGPVMGHQRTPSAMQDPLIYLGTNIPDPFRSAASHGEMKVAGYDPEVTFRKLNRLVSAPDLKEDEISVLLLSLNVFEMDALNDHYTAKTGFSLADTIDRTTGSTDWKMAIRAITLGPLGFDVDLARKSLAGIGTNEMLLVELILGRQGPDVRWLKAGYKTRYGKDLVDTVKSDLSGKLERLFVMALNTQKPLDSPYGQVDQRKVAEDVESLNAAVKKKDEIGVAEILINRSDTHIRAVITAYSQRYKSLSKVIKKTFSGIMEAALLYILHGVKAKRDGQGIWRDAKLLEKAMSGFGTKDAQLVYRLVRAYWSPARMEAIKDAYQRRYNKPLVNRVKGETSGAYQKLLVSIITSSERKEMPNGPK